MAHDIAGASRVRADELRRIAVIANPVAKSGAGARIAERVAAVLASDFGASSQPHAGDLALDVLLTERPRHAQELAASLPAEVDLVIAVGGDGLIHEIVNGLMTRPVAARPVLGVVPAGSGDDYAATLCMPSDPARAVAEIMAQHVVEADVGCVNGEYFAETLSFGLDAAIALDTVERRARTGGSGTPLYMASGFDQLLHHFDLTPFEAKLSGIPAAGGEGVSPATGMLSLAGSSYLFAVQVGPTYGGHFKVCPDARIDDGLFDICIAHPPLSRPQAIGIFLLAKGGRHTRFRQLSFYRASRVEVSFAHPLAVQADGERVEGTSFVVETVPHALRVAVGGRYRR